MTTKMLKVVKISDKDCLDVSRMLVENKDRANDTRYECDRAICSTCEKLFGTKDKGCGTALENKNLFEDTFITLLEYNNFEIPDKLMKGIEA